MQMQCMLCQFCDRPCLQGLRPSAISSEFITAGTVHFPLCALHTTSLVRLCFFQFKMYVTTGGSQSWTFLNTTCICFKLQNYWICKIVAFYLQSTHGPTGPVFCVASPHND